MRKALLVVLLLTACATKPKAPPLTAPDWTVLPPGVLDAFCARLQLDAIVTVAPVAVVSTTRPLAVPESLNALAMTVRQAKGDRVALSTQELNRSMPVDTSGAACSWRPIPASAMDAHRDEVMVELSAPSLHPFAPKSGGVLARVTVGGQGAAWYWITLIPRGRWVAGPVVPLVP